MYFTFLGLLLCFLHVWTAKGALNATCTTGSVACEDQKTTVQSSENSTVSTAWMTLSTTRDNFTTTAIPTDTTLISITLVTSLANPSQPFDSSSSTPTSRNLISTSSKSSLSLAGIHRRPSLAIITGVPVTISTSFSLITTNASTRVLSATTTVEPDRPTTIPCNARQHFLLSASNSTLIGNGLHLLYLAERNKFYFEPYQHYEADQPAVFSLTEECQLQVQNGSAWSSVGLPRCIIVGETYLEGYADSPKLIWLTDLVGQLKYTYDDVLIPDTVPLNITMQGI